MNRWNILTADEAVVNQLQSELKIHPKLCQLLVQRGIDTFEKAREFFRPEIAHLHDPFLMKDMHAAIDRINLAISKNERILVFGDYDVDGTTSVALVYGFLKKYYSNIDYYIPDRYAEGYGISYEGINYAKANNCTLIIALDLGITAIPQVQFAKENNIDFIICDHHRPGDQLPNAVAILDAKRSDNTYPFDELSGCGVGFKLLQAWCMQNGIDFAELENQLDLVAISIASDIVPLTGENRTLCFYGLKKINESPRPGIKALIEAAALKGELNVNSLVFTLGPRINAAGRIEHGRDAVKLLVSETVEDAFACALALNQHNLDRRGFDKDITTSALELIDSTPALQNKKTTVVGDESWHKGVIGIVASRLMEKYYRPTVVCVFQDGMAIGSARSVRDFDVYEALKGCADLLEKFGGHKYAAGVSMKMENYETFVNRFEEIVAATIDEELLIPEITIDLELEPEVIAGNFYKIIKQFEPYGPGNMTPVFLTRGMQDTGYSKIVSEKHLKLSLLKDRQRISGIGFGMSDYFPLLANKSKVDVCYSLYENEWQGNSSIEWRVKDIRASE